MSGMCPLLRKVILPVCVSYTELELSSLCKFGWRVSNSSVVDSREVIVCLGQAMVNI